MTEPPSPAAQVICKAIDDCFKASPAPPTVEDLAAAILRAAAVYCTRERRILMTIASELEGNNG